MMYLFFRFLRFCVCAGVSIMEYDDDRYKKAKLLGRVAVIGPIPSLIRYIYVLFFKKEEGNVDTVN